MAFSGRTRRIVAARAGYRCSFPQCNAITIGPNRSGGFILTGEAAHIHSPKPKGPRASTEYSDEYLDAPENGIWLCRKHHKAVDSTSGSDYPPSLLASYKDLHEQKIAYALLGVEPNITWLQTLRIERHYFLTAGVEINFAKLNLLSGRVGVGKSTLCRLIVAAFSDLHPHEKLSREPAATYEIELFDSEPKTLRIETQPSRKLFTLNGEQHFLYPVPLEVVYAGKATSRTEDGILSAPCIRIRTFSGATRSDPPVRRHAENRIPCQVETLCQWGHNWARSRRSQQ